MDIETAKMQITAILAEAEEEYIYERMDDDPPEVDWDRLTAAVLAVVEQLQPEVVHVIGT